MFEPTHLNTLARHAHACAEGKGQGGTAYAVGTPKRRYVVGGLSTRIFPIGTAVPVLRAAMHAMAGSYDGAVADTLGYWEDGGRVYVDLGSFYHDRDIALGVARERGELAIFDRETGQCIPVNAA